MNAPSLVRLVIIGLVAIALTDVIAGVVLALSRRVDTAIVISIFSAAQGAVGGLCALLANGSDVPADQKQQTKPQAELQNPPQDSGHVGA